MVSVGTFDAGLMIALNVAPEPAVPLIQPPLPSERHDPVSNKKNDGLVYPDPAVFTVMLVTLYVLVPSPSSAVLTVNVAPDPVGSETVNVKADV